MLNDFALAGTELLPRLAIIRIVVRKVGGHDAQAGSIAFAVCVRPHNLVVCAKRSFPESSEVSRYVI